MKHNDIIDMVIVVTKQGSFIADYPEEIDDWMNGYDCEDNCVSNVPREHGVYKCKAKYWYEQGYDDMGYPASGESDWGFEIVSTYKVY